MSHEVIVYGRLERMHIEREICDEVMFEYVPTDEALSGMHRIEPVPVETWIRREHRGNREGGLSVYTPKEKNGVCERKAPWWRIGSRR